MLEYFTHHKGYMIFKSGSMFIPNVDTDIQVDSLKLAIEAIDSFVEKQNEILIHRDDEVQISSSLRWFNNITKYSSPETLN